MTLRPSRRQRRWPSIGPVLPHDPTFCTLRSSSKNALGSPACFQGHPGCSAAASHRSAWQRPPFAGLTKQNTTKSLSLRRREYVSGTADRAVAALNVTSDAEQKALPRRQPRPAPAIVTGTAP
jgi:hypothetical protein